MSEPLIQINPAWDAQTQANWRAMQALRQAQNNQGGVDTRALADIRNMAAQAVSQVGQVNVKVENLQKALGSLQSSDPDLSEVEDAIEGLRSSVSTLEGLALLSGGGPTEAFPIQVPEKSTYWVGSDPEDDFSTVQDAIDYLAPMVMMNTTTIRVKPGTYSNGGGTVAKFQAIPFAANLVLQGDTRAGIGSTWFIHTGTALAYDGTGTTFKLADKADAVATGKINGIAAGDKVYLYGWGDSQNGEQTVLEVNSAAGTVKVSGDLTGATIDRASTCTFLPNVVFEGWGGASVCLVDGGCRGVSLRGIMSREGTALGGIIGFDIMNGSAAAIGKCVSLMEGPYYEWGRGLRVINASSIASSESDEDINVSLIGEYRQGALIQISSSALLSVASIGARTGVMSSTASSASANGSIATYALYGAYLENIGYCSLIRFVARKASISGVCGTLNSVADARKTIATGLFWGNTSNFSPPVSGEEGNSGAYIWWN